MTHPTNRRTLFNILGLMALAGVCVPLFDYGATLRRSDYMASYSRQVAFKWAENGARTFTLKDWRLVRHATAEAIALSPKNPTLYDQMALAFIMRARASNDPTVRKNFYEEAAANTKRSLALRPGHGWSLAMRAEELMYTDTNDVEMWRNWEAAEKRAPYEIAVQSTLFVIARAKSGNVPSNLADWMARIKGSSSQRIRQLASD